MEKKKQPQTKTIILLIATGLIMVFLGIMTGKYLV